MHDSRRKAVAAQQAQLQEEVAAKLRRLRPAQIQIARYLALERNTLLVGCGLRAMKLQVVYCGWLGCGW